MSPEARNGLNGRVIQGPVTNFGASRNGLFGLESGPHPGFECQHALGQSVTNPPRTRGRDLQPAGRPPDYLSRLRCALALVRAPGAAGRVGYSVSDRTCSTPRRLRLWGARRQDQDCRGAFSCAPGVNAAGNGKSPGNQKGRAGTVGGGIHETTVHLPLANLWAQLGLPRPELSSMSRFSLTSVGFLHNPGLSGRGPWLRHQQHQGCTGA